jgi:hypothetical protein
MVEFPLPAALSPILALTHFAPLARIDCMAASWADWGGCRHFFTKFFAGWFCRIFFAHPDAGACPFRSAKPERASGRHMRTGLCAGKDTPQWRPDL